MTAAPAPTVATLRAALFAAFLEYSEAKTDAARGDAWAGMVRAMNAFERAVAAEAETRAEEKRAAGVLKSALARPAWCPDCKTLHGAGAHTRPLPITDTTTTTDDGGSR